MLLVNELSITIIKSPWHVLRTPFPVPLYRNPLMVGIAVGILICIPLTACYRAAYERGGITFYSLRGLVKPTKDWGHFN